MCVLSQGQVKAVSEPDFRAYSRRFCRSIGVVFMTETEDRILRESFRTVICPTQTGNKNTPRKIPLCGFLQTGMMSKQGSNKDFRLG